MLRRWLTQRNAVAAPSPIALGSTLRVNEGPTAPASTGAAQFVPINVHASAAAVAVAVADIRIELRRGPITVSVSWPTHEAVACAAWLRECLR